MPTTIHNVLAPRNDYFVNVDIATDPINCGDDRSSDLERYVHVFGGVIFLGYTSMILDEVGQTGVDLSLAVRTEDAVQQLRAHGIGAPGVHSDEANEQGASFRAEQADGGVGCGYAGKRAAISRLIADNAAAIIAQAVELMPELFASETAKTFAEQVAAAHGRLADQTEGQGRTVVRTAVAAGAGVAMFAGEHTTTDGIINTQSGSSFQTQAALAANQAAYDHDLWASDELMARTYGDRYDRSQVTIASLIDVIGTMRALGVTRIAVR